MKLDELQKAIPRYAETIAAVAKWNQNKFCIDGSAFSDIANGTKNEAAEFDKQTHLGESFNVPSLIAAKSFLQAVVSWEVACKNRDGNSISSMRKIFMEEINGTAQPLSKNVDNDVIRRTFKCLVAGIFASLCEASFNQIQKDENLLSSLTTVLDRALKDQKALDNKIADGTIDFLHHSLRAVAIVTKPVVANGSKSN